MVYLTAGAAGMYCGSCLHDNALAKALVARGHDAILVPVYTPIQTDLPDASERRLFYGGLNVYLQQLSPVFRWLPKWADGFLSSPRLVGWIASRAMGTSAKNLGALTVSMLQGEHGKQRKEVERLQAWLSSLAPDAIIFSNLLIAGSLPALRRELPDAKCMVMLQGDDIFYNGLIEPYRTAALKELRRLAGQVDQFIVHSHEYRTRMSGLLETPLERFTVCPLSVDADDLLSLERSISPDRPPSVGYLARLAPDKGLHLLVDAFIELAKGDKLNNVRLEIAGWLGKQYEEYWNEQRNKLEAAGLAGRYHFWGTIDRTAKQRFLTSIDVLSVPTTHPEPKGLFVLEAMAAGVPYLLPAHGAFPELHQRAQIGRLHAPESVSELATGLLEMFERLDETRRLAARCREYVQQHALPDHEAEAVERIAERINR